MELDPTYRFDEEDWNSYPPDEQVLEYMEEGWLEWPVYEEAKGG